MTINASGIEARESARDKSNGQFGVQVHTRPELELSAESEMATGETREMPLTNPETYWFADTLPLAEEIATEHNVTGTVTRVFLPEDCPDPAARYVASLRNADTGETYPFIYDTGDQYFEQGTPTVAEVLAEATFQAHGEGGKVSESGRTALDRLIGVVGEKSARGLLATEYLANSYVNAAETRYPDGAVADEARAAGHRI